MHAVRNGSRTRGFSSNIQPNENRIIAIAIGFVEPTEFVFETYFHTLVETDTATTASVVMVQGNETRSRACRSYITRQKTNRQMLK